MTEPYDPLQEVKDAGIRADLRAAEADTNWEPTKAQIQAGNYKKGTVVWQGMEVRIENPRDSVRTGTTKEGKPWRTVMKNAYGHLATRYGRSAADGDGVDVFIGDHPDSALVGVVDQYIDGKFDEHKAVLGTTDAEDAERTYLANYQKGWQGCGAVTLLTAEQFKSWVLHGDTGKPIKGQKFEDFHKEAKDSPCPICTEHAVGRCRCGGPHSMEDLKKGHGLQCKNGHRWSGELAYDPGQEKSAAKRKEVYGVDLDGTLAHHDPKAPFKLNQIGQPVEKMLEQVKAWLDEGIEVVIFTARANNPKSLPVIKRWLDAVGLPELTITNEKTPQMTRIYDDRAWHVERNTGEIKEARSGFHRPENFDVLKEHSTEKLKVEAGCNDWESAWTGITFTFPNLGRQVWAHLSPPASWIDCDTPSKDQPTRQEVHDWQDKLVKGWLSAAKELARQEEATLHPEHFLQAAKDTETKRWIESVGENRMKWDPVKQASVAPPAQPDVQTVLPPRTGPEAILHALQNLDLEKLRADSMDVVHRKLKSKRPAAVQILGYLEGLKRAEIQPHQLMITRVPVLPPQFRPFTAAGETFIPGDANELYRDLVNVRSVYEQMRERLGEDGAKAARLNLYDAMAAVYGFGEPVSPKTRERGVTGFLKQVTGSSPKFSIAQRNLLSKDVDYVGRGTIGVDPDLGMDEIGIPDEMAWKLYAPFIQRRLVRAGMSPEQAVKQIKDRTKEAEKMMDGEMAERPVMYSRAPAWHKFNFVAGRPKRRLGNTIMVNPFVTSGLNADFNGDSVKLDYGFVPVLINGELVALDFENLVAQYVMPGFSEDMAVSDLGVGTQIYEFAKDYMCVLGLREDGTPGWVPAGAISIHTSHSDECQRVTSARGLSAVFTSHHNFVKLDAQCNFVPVKTGDVQVGDLIPLLQNYALPTLIREMPLSPRPIPDDFPTGFWFGYYLGDGSVTGRMDTVSQASVDSTTLDYLERAGAAFIAETPWREGNGLSSRWTSRPWVEFLLREVGAGCAGKKVPAWMITMSPSFQHGLIAGFFAAEGSVSGSVARIEVVNPNMLTVFRFLLESKGVPCAINPGKPASERRQATYVLQASADRLLALGIAWPDIRKCDQFRSMKPCTRCPDWNRVPLPAWLKASLLQQGRLFVGGRGRHKTNARPAGKVPDSKQMKFSFKRGYCSRDFALKLIDGYALEDVKDEPVQRWIAIVKDTRIAWDIITDMSPVERPIVTYDFSVPGMELFAIAGGFLTHNTVAVHLPIMDATVGDAKNKLMPSRMLLSPKDRDKVVPGLKQEQILGLHNAQARPALAKHVFPDERTAMMAIRSGKVRMSDEIEIGAPAGKA